MVKCLYFDVESTGLISEKNNIIQLSGIIEIDGVIKEEFNYKMKPTRVENIQQEALDIQKRTKEEILSWPDQKEAYNDFITKLDKYCDKYKKDKTIEDRFYFAGHNVNFDVKFLIDWFKNINNNQFYGSYFNLNPKDYIDSLVIVRKYKKALNLDNCKLYTVVNKLLGEEFKFNSHDALHDIYATKMCLEVLYELYPEYFPKEFRKNEK